MADTSRISPTAHYTGYVWHRHGLSHPALRTRTGAVLYNTLQPLLRGYHRMTGHTTLEMFLLRRHKVIDHLLEQAITSGAVTQVIEIAAGLSPRGLRFMQRFGATGLRYIEGDLPDMAATKRARLDAKNLRGSNHHVVTLNALLDEGPESLAGVATKLCDPGQGVAILTEGLVNYFDRQRTEAMWTRFARFSRDYPDSVYLSDLHVHDEAMKVPIARAFQGALSAFARGSVHFHYRTPTEATRALHSVGFGSVSLHQPEVFSTVLTLPDAGVEQDIVRIVEARP